MSTGASSRSQHLQVERGEVVTLHGGQCGQVGHLAARRQHDLDGPACGGGNERHPVRGLLNHARARTKLGLQHVTEQRTPVRRVVLQARLRASVRCVASRTGTRRSGRAGARASRRSLHRGSRTGRPARHLATLTRRRPGPPTRRRRCARGTTESSPNDLLWSEVKHTTSQRPTPRRADEQRLTIHSGWHIRHVRTPATGSGSRTPRRRSPPRESPSACPASTGTAGKGPPAACRCASGGARPEPPTRGSTGRSRTSDIGWVSG